jgi:rhamnogalacturonyl hydrolase YesR
MALAEVSEQPRYLDALRVMGSALGWRLGGPPYGANGHCVGQMYLAMYARSQDPALIADVEARFDWILKHPPGTGLKYGEKADRWTWSDALFMAPPVWARLAALTGDQRYLDFLDREWWATTDHLYVKEERLFHRDDRFATRREPNGERVFWSRGNAWVVAGLVRVLDALPEGWRGRARYAALLREMSARVAALQPPDGLWRPSLLDPASYPTPETSGSALFCYALARGIRHGILERDAYWPAVDRAWQGLARSVSADGRLGWVQLPASLPEGTREEATAPYGVGAFLLAGREVHALLTAGRASEALP